MTTLLWLFRFKKEKDEREEQRKEAERKTLAEQAAKADRDAAQRSTISRLQFRLPDGRSRTHEFLADSTLGRSKVNLQFIHCGCILSSEATL